MLFQNPDLSRQDRVALLQELSQQVSVCQACKLASTRSTTVFGEGNPEAEIMFIGEGPGRQEDLQGRPFVGRAGELLTRIIELGMGVPRTQVFIANLVKCRPTVDLRFERDRPPDQEEQEACTPFLTRQIQIIQPRVIVTLGSPATKYLLKTTTGITRLRGNWAEFESIPVMPTFHPSYVLRNGGEQSPLRRVVWHDIKLVLARLGWPIPGKQS